MRHEQTPTDHDQIEIFVSPRRARDVGTGEVIDCEAARSKAAANRICHQGIVFNHEYTHATKHNL